MEQCELCRKAIAEGELYGQFLMNIEKMIDYTVYVKESKAITTLCYDCAQQFNSFEDAKRLID